MPAKEPAVNLRASRLALCLLALLAMPALCAAQAPTVWKPDPKLLSQLGPEVSVGDYKMRLPHGYKLQPMQQTPNDAFNVTVYKYKSKTRADGSRASIVVAFASVRSSTPPLTAQQSTKTFLQSLNNTLKNCAASPTEQGFIADQPFVRGYFIATAPQSKRMLHGFIYIMLNGNMTVHLFAEDYMAINKKPLSVDTLPLAEAATLTFRRG